MNITPPEPDKSRTELDQELVTELRQRLLHEESWHRFTLVHRTAGSVLRESLRPILLHNTRHWQLEQQRDGRTTVRNLTSSEELASTLERLVGLTGPREYHLLATDGDLHLRVTRKGRMLLSRAASQQGGVVKPKPHDREKQQPLDQFDAAPLLRVLNISDRRGMIRASMRNKYNQINAFLRQLEVTLPQQLPEGDFEVVDCGAGLAYLTFATSAYLSTVHGLKPRITGIDCNPEIVAQANNMARDLDLADSVTFIAEDLLKCNLQLCPHLLLSLHACDDATDAALARGVEWGAETMLVAPCCQHDLQQQLGARGPMRALLRHAILRERQADLITDACRAQLLRILGYRVRVVEFVSHGATPRNLMLRATAGLMQGQGAVVDEYLALRDFWRITPALERLLASRLAPLLGTDAAAD